jgi:RNA polymerase sigma factor (TIGR02999 family)
MDDRTPPHSDRMPLGADAPSPADLTARVLTLGNDPAAAEAMFPLVYEELRRMARRALDGEQTGHTLDTTALVHEAYLRLVDSTRVPWEDRSRFLAVAATAMRHILIDYARRRRAQKRGRAPIAVDLDKVQLSTDDSVETLVAMDDALTRLAALSPRLVQVVECRFFIGMTEDETATALGVTARTVRRDWLKAKGWLAVVMSGQPPDSAPSQM